MLQEEDHPVQTASFRISVYLDTCSGTFGIGLDAHGQGGRRAVCLRRRFSMTHVLRSLALGLLDVLGIFGVFGQLLSDPCQDDSGGGMDPNGHH
jgi:hypothetical protein